VEKFNGRYVSPDLRCAGEIAPSGTYGLLVEPREFGNVYGVASNWKDEEAPVYAYRGELSDDAECPSENKIWVKLDKKAKDFHCNPYCALIPELKLAYIEQLFSFDRKGIIEDCARAVFFETGSSIFRQDVSYGKEN